MYSISAKRHKNSTKKAISQTIIFTSFCIIGILGNLAIKEKIEDKKIETYLIDKITSKEELENMHSEEKVKLNEEIQKLNKNIEVMKQEKVSRGEAERANEAEKRKIIKTIESKLKGKLKGKGEYIYISAKNNNLNSLLVTSIILHESASGTSTLTNTHNNVAGITKNGGKRFRRYETIDNGIDAVTNLLNEEYVSKGFNTIEKIGNKYCPVGASNDPKGINKYWIPTVSRIYFNLKEEVNNGN